jgi:hypothetical protein
MAIIVWTTSLLVLVSIGTLILLFRTRSRSAAAMALGAAIVWVGIALAAFGPTTSVPIPEEAQELLEEDGGLHSFTEMRSPVAPIGFIVSIGSTIFGIGFPTHALGSRR